MYTSFFTKINKIFKLKENIILIFILLLYLSLTLWRMEEWPLYNDEVTIGALSNNIINNKVPFYQSYVYEGPLSSYILIPSLLFGKNIFFLRLPIVLINLLLIFFLYLFTQKYYNKKVALLSSLILAITPNQILNSSIARTASIIPFFMFVSLYLFYKFAESRKNSYLYLISFIWGLAAMTRPTFFFFIMAFLLTLKFNPLISFKEFRRKLTIKNLTLILFFFLLGSFPMIYYNLVSNFATLNSILTAILMPRGFNENLFDIKGNLERGYLDFVNFLDVDYKGYLYSELIGKPYNFSLIFFISLAFFSFITIKEFYRYGITEDVKKNIYLLINFILIWIFKSTITITFSDNEDFLMLFPFCSMIMAWSMIYIADSLKNMITKIIFIIFIIFIFSSNFYNFVTKYPELLEAARQKANICHEITFYILNYSKDMTTSSIVFETVRKSFFDFYNDDKNIKSFVLISKYDDTKLFSLIVDTEDLDIDKIHKKWNNYLNENTSFIFVRNECNPNWAANINFYELFAKFANEQNKTLVLIRNVSIDNKQLLSIFKVT
jgi:4-amino-4-deoxy-L-arabinose transferase-like glycosyltransferase